MFSFLTDSVLRDPILGSIFMCMAASLMGGIALLQRRALLGEAVSHATYPGIALSLSLCSVFSISTETYVLGLVILGAILLGWLSIQCIEWMESNQVASDTALCFTIASFFGIGILIMSWLQDFSPLHARALQMYLYGQPATMTFTHVVVGSGLCLLVSLFLYLAYHPLQAWLCDEVFATSSGISVRWLKTALRLLTLVTIAVAIRSAGIVLISAMLIAPPLAARQYTDRLGLFFIYSGLFGALSGLLGNLIAIQVSAPTGPLIALTSASFAYLSLIFAPQKGWVARVYRLGSFQWKCAEENILKSIWKKGILQPDKRNQYPWVQAILLLRMKRQGWIIASPEGIKLTSDGMKRAARIVRLHRLWETYLANLGWPEEHVHKTAEEMEHILTPELEEKIAVALAHPTVDPHSQPIPGRDR